MRSFQLGARRIRMSTGSAATGGLVLVLEKGFKFLSIDPDPYIVIRRSLRLSVMRAWSIQEGGFGVQITDEPFATARGIGRFGRRPLGVVSSRRAITAVRFAFVIAMCEVNAPFLGSESQRIVWGEMGRGRRNNTCLSSSARLARLRQASPFRRVTCVLMHEGELHGRTSAAL